VSEVDSSAHGKKEKKSLLIKEKKALLMYLVSEVDSSAQAFGGPQVLLVPVILFT
jgi:hypothetical protein